MNYLQLTNAVLAELNEVKLTSSNFASGAVGIQQTTKDVVNKSLRDVYPSEMEWPWLHSDKTQVTYAGQKEYSLPTDFRSVDFESFYFLVVVQLQLLFQGCSTKIHESHFLKIICLHLIDLKKCSLPPSERRKRIKLIKSL